MNFTSPLFLTGFPAVCLIYRKLPEHKASGLLSRRTFLLLASWLFYMGGSLLCFPLLFLVTLITYLGGISIEKACAETKDRAKAILALVLFFVLSKHMGLGDLGKSLEILRRGCFRLAAEERGRLA